MKKVIVGRPLTLNRPNVLESYLALLKKYWDEGDIILTEQYNNHSAMLPNKVYGTDGLYGTKFITPVTKIRYEIQSDRYRYGKLKFARDIEHRERCISFRPVNSAYYQAFFYLKSKTFLFGWRVDLNFLRSCLDQLEQLGHIVPREVPEGAYRPKCNIVEIHDGVPEIVLAPERETFCTVGTDPEFEVLRNNLVIRPPSYYKGTGSNVRIGLDGAGCQIEFRPKAGTPESVVEDLKSLFEEVMDPITVLGNTYPLGGHIHIGVGFQANPTPELLWLLDYFLGRPTIALSGAARGGYCKFSAYESKPWGFEYRTPPAAIFATPEFARLSMKICKEVVECYHNGQTIKVTEPAPTKEDYLNYCGFTDEEYDQWLNQIAKYKEFMAHENRTKYNISHKWVESVPSTTKISSICPAATWKTGKCINLECLNCYPSTAPAVRAARIAREQHDQSLRRTEQVLREQMEREARQRQEAAARARHEVSNRLDTHLLNMNDEWSIEALTRVVDLLDALQYQPRHEVYLIGLAERRGRDVVLGVEVEGMQQTEGFEELTHRYGVPHYLRMVDPSDPKLESIIRAIVEKERSLSQRYGSPSLSIFDEQCAEVLPDSDSDLVAASREVALTTEAEEDDECV